jgi:flagellar biosynthetic protein FlhB
MTKQEVKDERRSHGGRSSEVKGTPAQAGEPDHRCSSVGKAVPEADVVVTNPTHFSVAIKYDTAHHEVPPSVVTAKGADFLALRIRQVARKNSGVPIVERAPLARALCTAGVEVGQESLTRALPGGGRDAGVCVQA